MTSFTPAVQMQNVVATFNLGTSHVDLDRLATSTTFVEYNPRKFAAATARIMRPRTTALIFASGNMVVTGAKDEALSCLAARKYVNILQSIGMDVTFRNFAIQNLVASSYVGGLLKLSEMAAAYGACCGYEPDMFPGLVLRLTSPKVVFLCFRSGKIVITGAKDRDVIDASMAKIYSEIFSNFIDTGGMSSNSADYRHECMRRDLGT